MLTRPFVLITLASVAFATASGLMSSTAALLVVHQMGLPASYIGLVLGLTAVAALAMRMPIGAAVDQFGSRGFAALGLSLCGAAALIFGLASNSPVHGELPAVVVLASALWGAGIAGFTTASGAYVANTVSAQRRSEAAGLFGIGTTLGQGIGAGIGYTLATERGFLFLYGGAVLVVLLGVALVGTLREVRGTREYPRPAMALELSVIAPTLALFTLVVANGVALTAVPLLGIGRDIENPGVYFAALATASVVGRFAGRIADRRGRLTVVLPAMVLAGAGQVVLIQASGVVGVAVAGLMFGLGFAVAQSTLLAYAIDLAHPSRRGRALGTFSSAADLGVLLGTNAGALLLTRGSLAGAFTFSAAVPLIGAVALGIWARRRA